jgi:hypothetical protein
VKSIIRISVNVVMIDVGNRDGADEHGPPVADEQPHDDRSEQAAQHQVLFERFDRLLDVGRLFFDYVDLDSGGQQLSWVASFS